MTNKSITIFGLGAIGSNVGFNLLAAEPNIVLNGIDKDIVEQRNLVNQIFSKNFVGQSKVDAFVAEVFMRTQNMPKGKYVKIEVGKDSFYTKADLFIDAFDNFLSRDRIQTMARESKTCIIHLGFGAVKNDLFGTVQWNDAYKTEQSKSPNQDVCEIPDATWWIRGATAIMTKNILDFLRKDKMNNIIIYPDLSVRNL